MKQHKAYSFGVIRAYLLLVVLGIFLAVMVFAHRLAHGAELADGRGKLGRNAVLMPGGCFATFNPANQNLRWTCWNWGTSE